MYGTMGCLRIGQAGPWITKGRKDNTGILFKRTAPILAVFRLKKFPPSLTLISLKVSLLFFRRLVG
jgi:hypothetical protein